MPPPILLAIVGSLLAAAGQLCLKLGATGATSLMDFVNVRLASGLGLYALGTVVWLFALAKLPLSRVYPFTILTFVVVYIASFALLREPITAPVMLGAALVVAGLIVIAAA
jgi:drug/metabolite transporter (DMT)-like permease